MSKYKISEEDKSLFRQAVEGPIIPTVKSREVVVKVREVAVKPREVAASWISLSDGYRTELSGQTALYYKKSAIEKNQFDRFKQGKLSIEGKLDLHGHTSEEAKSALLAFLTRHLALGHRTLLIIHGKGKPERPSQLKNLINHWLPQIPEVLAFVSAQAKDGGTGAIYVLLKKS